MVGRLPRLPRRFALDEHDRPEPGQGVGRAGEGPDGLEPVEAVGDADELVAAARDGPCRRQREELFVRRGVEERGRVRGDDELRALGCAGPPEVLQQGPLETRVEVEFRLDDQRRGARGRRHRVGVEEALHLPL